MAIKRIDKYTAATRYEIVTPEELREARWLVEQGFFRDMDDYINCLTRAEARGAKQKDVEKERKAKIGTLKRTDVSKKRKAA